MIAPRAQRVRSGLLLASSLVWLTLLPAAEALAATPTVTPGSVTLTATSTTSKVGGAVTFTASASDPGGTPLYQFWVEEPTGAWVQAEPYSAANTFTLSTPSAGDYLVAVDVLDQAQVKAGDWSAAQTTLSDGVFVGSAVTVTAAAGASGPAGSAVTLTAHATAIFDPLYQFWWEQGGVWHQSGNYSTADSYTFTPTGSGTVTYVAYAKSPLAANNPAGALASPVGTFTQYGVASQVALHFASPTVVADGRAADALTVTVEDSAGTPVLDYSGTVTVSASAALFNGETATRVTLVNGSAVVSATAAAAGVDTVTADHLMSAPGLGPTAGQAANITYGQATVTATAAGPAGLQLTAALPDLATATVTPDTVTVTLVDAAGNPVSSVAPVNATITVSGPGSLTAAGTTTTEVVALTGSTTFQIWSALGGQGAITVTAVATGLTAGTLQVPTYQSTTGDRLVITHTAGANASGHYTLYTVTLENSAGAVVTTGAAASGVLTVADNQPSVANWNDSNAVYYWFGGNLTAGEANGDPTGASVTDLRTSVARPLQFSLPLSGGSATFMAQSYASGSPVTITVAGDGLGASTTYQYQVGAGGYAVIEAQGNDQLNLQGVGPDYNAAVAPGQTVTVSAQLTDANGVAVHEAGQPIWFVLNPNSNAAGTLAVLPNGASHAGNAYEAFTNASGIASATITVPSGAPSTNGVRGTSSGIYDYFYIGAAGPAQVSAGTPAPDNWYGNPTSGVRKGWGPAYYVVPSAGITTTLNQVANGHWPADGRFAAGTSSVDVPGQSSYLWFTADNALGAGAYLPHSAYWAFSGSSANGLEVLLVTSTDPAVVSAGGEAVGPNQWVATYPVSAVSSTLYVPPLMFGQAGSATLTVEDLSSPTHPTVSLPVTVLPGTSTDTAVLEYHGQPISPSNPVVLPPNTPVELQWVNVDAGGDPVPVTAPAGARGVLTAPNGTLFETTLGGVTSPSATLTIPSGQTSANVWVVSSGGSTMETDLSANDYAHLVVRSTPSSDQSGNYTLYTVLVENPLGQVITSGAYSSANFTVSDNQPFTANWNDSNAVDYYYSPDLGSVGNQENFSASDYNTTRANPMVFTVGLSGGSGAFAAQSFVSGSPVTISVGDGNLAPVNTTYQYALGTGGYAAVLTDGQPLSYDLALNSGLTQTPYKDVPRLVSSVAPSGAVTVTAQLTDSNTQAVASANQPIWFQVDALTSALAAIAVSGSTGPTYYPANDLLLTYAFAPFGGDTSAYESQWVEAYTNGAGQATITVLVNPKLAGNLSSGVFVVRALGEYEHDYLGYVPVPEASYSAYYAVVPSSEVATSLASGRFESHYAPPYFAASSISVNNFPNWAGAPLTFQAMHSGVAAYSAHSPFWNFSTGNVGVGSVLVTSTNPNVLALPSSPYQDQGYSVAYYSGVMQVGPNEWVLEGQAFTSGYVTLPPFFTGMSGQATLTVTDIGSVANPSQSVTVSVLPAYTAGAELKYQGTQISANNPVFLTPDQPVEVQVVNVDVAGDPVPVDEAGKTVSFTAPAGMAFETSLNGPASATVSVTIPSGASSVNLWVVSAGYATLSSDLFDRAP